MVDHWILFIIVFLSLWSCDYIYVTHHHEYWSWGIRLHWGFGFVYFHVYMFCFIHAFALHLLISVAKFGAGLEIMIHDGLLIWFYGFVACPFAFSYLSCEWTRERVSVVGSEEENNNFEREKSKDSLCFLSLCALFLLVY